jgi:hypothetical protein
MTDNGPAKVLYLSTRLVVPVVTVEEREVVALVDRGTMAILLHVHPATVDRLADRGDFRRIYVGSKPRFDLDDFEAFKARGGCRYLGE